jgi:uncharacterized protein (UPF0333 family)
MMKTNIKKNETGSLSLEYILFIGAVVVIAAGLGIFYRSIGDYFARMGNEVVSNEIPVINYGSD